MDTVGRAFCPLFRGCPFVRGRNVWTVNGRGKQFVHCREVVLLSECPLSECPLIRVSIIGGFTVYMYIPTSHSIICIYVYYTCLAFCILNVQVSQIYSACDNPNVKHALFGATLASGVEEFCHTHFTTPVRIIVGLK